jgi:uncharacterized protein YbbC (DUF1343 family)
MAPMTASTTLQTGLDVLVRDEFQSLRGKRIGLVTHPAARSRHLLSAAELFAAHTNLVKLFGPEHGFHGDAQDLIPVPGQSSIPSAARSIPCHSLYGDTFESLTPTRAMLEGLDLLVIDLQDVGSRYYTFQATMLSCMQACEKIGLPVMVLDRPNPIGGDIEGPGIDPGFESFVGPHSIPIRHGLTMCELAKLYQAELTPRLQLKTICCTGMKRRWGWPFDRVWLPPSPNMPSVETARVYPGGCLYEGTNLSEGRGTTRPFETVGHPQLQPDHLVKRLREFDLKGVAFLPMQFKPTFHKYANQNCGGCFIVPTSRSEFRPVRVGLAVLMACRELLGDQFHWRTERYEFVDHIPAIDLLFGSDRVRKQIDSQISFEEITRDWAEFETTFYDRTQSIRLYS